jgi:Cu(I)/Ag(I) efflux system protein CusF
MKLLLTTVLAFVVAAPAFAQPAGDMTGMPGMAAGDHAGMTMADGSGVVTAVDMKAGTVSIHHSPIAKLGWPAMTMSFKASPPSILQGISVGQAVTFTLMQMNGENTITAIQPK